MDRAAATLPDDIDVLKGIIVEQQQRIDILEEYFRLSRLQRFGASSEKAPGQGELFNEAEQLDEAGEEAESETVATEASSAPKARRRPKRKPLPPELARVEIEHDLPEAEKRCACGCELVVIGEERSEQLDIVPAKVQVLVHVRKKYACRRCEEGVTLAPLPAQPIPKSNASPGLLAHIAVAKYQDALPLYRQTHILARLGIELSRHTLAGWLIRCAALVQPLLNLLNDQLLAHDNVHCDETPLQVLKEPGKAPQSQSYMWVRITGPPGKKIVLYHYADARSGAVAEALLGGLKGHLCTDDYGGYNGVGQAAELTHRGCWAHARRKFVEAQKAAGGKGKKAKTGRADVALRYIGKLYAIERAVKDESVEVRYEVRQRDARPVLAELKGWLDKAMQHVLPKGALGRAMAYLHKNWDKLTVYIEDGRLAIDNNIAENAIRPFVVGRKNWLCAPRRSKPKEGHFDHALQWMRVGPSQRDCRITLQTA